MKFKNEEKGIVIELESLTREYEAFPHYDGEKDIMKENATDIEGNYWGIYWTQCNWEKEELEDIVEDWEDISYLTDEYGYNYYPVKTNDVNLISGIRRENALENSKG